MRGEYLMTKFLIGLLSLSSLLVACSYSRSVSQMMYEKAVVVDVIYTPRMNDYTHYNSHIFEVQRGIYDLAITGVYSIVFHCEHDKNFVIQGETENYRYYWQNLAPGDSVVIDYRERYKTDKEGNVTVYNYDFIKATKIK